jgi:P-type Cu+ transporter
MSCSNCVMTISRYLEKQGLRNIRLNLASGDLSFQSDGAQIQPKDIRKGIEGLGYHVVGELGASPARAASVSKPMNKYLRNLLICLPFTLLLMVPMLPVGPPLQALMNPWMQLVLCLPVYLIGMSFFGRSGLKSIRNGLPNMNVLISLGATSSFLYSLVGTVLNLGEGYIFYETAAAIITLIFFGNYLEDISMHATQRALNSLAKSQKVMANLIAFDELHQEVIMPLENTQLRPGDLVLVKSGELVPADCKILWGDAWVNESILTGESLPLAKKAKDLLLGGSLLTDGTLKAQVTALAQDSALSNIVNLVRRAQGEKPPVQQLADRISAVFVPVVLAIALLTFISNYWLLHQLTPALMRSVAVLVIACPCAMGLATPAAISVGLGRAARGGILFRNAKSLELFKDIRQVAFDKTGTLTTGDFVIDRWQAEGDRVAEQEFKMLASSLEKYSNHPIAKAVYKAWKSKDEMSWAKVNEIKGVGIKAISQAGDEYWAGSFKIASQFTDQEGHSIYLLRNNILLGWIDLSDELRPESQAVIGHLRDKGFKTILLSGDRLQNCQNLAAHLGMDEVIAEQTPEQKLDQIAQMTASRPTALVGDGINDAPALARATVGISMSDASQLAMQSADVVLVGQGLKHLTLALGLGRHTFLTIQQNLFWAFFYNALAIPVAAIGLLTPTVAALAMALSDVILIGNSLRLFVKQVDRGGPL